MEGEGPSISVQGGVSSGEDSMTPGEDPTRYPPPGEEQKSPAGVQDGGVSIEAQMEENGEIGCGESSPSQRQSRRSVYETATLMLQFINDESCLCLLESCPELEQERGHGGGFLLLRNSRYCRPCHLHGTLNPVPLDVAAGEPLLQLCLFNFKRTIVLQKMLILLDENLVLKFVK